MSAAILLALPDRGGAYLTGPPEGHTGGFEEPTCHRCHFDHPVGAEGGRLELQGLPVSYEPGASYRITIVLERPGMARAGFQLSSRFLEGELRGGQAGVLRAYPPGGTRVDILETPAGVLYAQHTQEGSRRLEGGEPPRALWGVEWTAPERPGGTVVFHLAANAGNDDDSEFGDYVYLETALSSPRSAPPSAASLSSGGE